MFVLLVTWLIAGQPPSNYQVTFNSAAACERARAAVYLDAAQMAKAEAARQAAADAELARKGVRVVATIDPPPPRVSAVCAARN